MKRYYCLTEDNQIFISQPLAQQPEKSILFFPSDFVKPAPVFKDGVFTGIQEAVTQDELEAISTCKTEEIREEYRLMLAKTDWYELRELRGGAPVPEDVKLHRQQLIDECNLKVQQLKK